MQYDVEIDEDMEVVVEGDVYGWVEQVGNGHVFHATEAIPTEYLVAIQSAIEDLPLASNVSETWKPRTYTYRIDFDANELQRLSGSDWIRYGSGGTKTILRLIERIRLLEGK